MKTSKQKDAYRICQKLFQAVLNRIASHNQLMDISEAELAEVDDAWELITTKRLDDMSDKDINLIITARTIIKQHS